MQETAHKSRAEHVCTAETHRRGSQGNFHILSVLLNIVRHCSLHSEEC